MQNPNISIFIRLMLALCFLTYVVHTAQSQDAVFKTYKDSAGFSCEFPSDWSFEQGVNTDRFFTGPDETSLDATIIIQVIDRDKTAEKTANTQLESLKPEFLAQPDGRILSEGTAPIVGQEVPFLIASYTTKDTAGKLRQFRHIQMVVTAPRVFLLMSYSAPDGIFDDTLKVFQNCSATLKLEAAEPPALPANDSTGTEETLIWRHNADRAFWIAVPSIWTKTIDDSEPYSVDMQHPDRVEGVIVFVVDVDATGTVKEYADAWEQILANKIFFMSDRLAVPQTNHPSTGLSKAPGIMREYQGETNGATVRSVAAYVFDNKRGFTVIGYHFLGDEKGEKRIRAAVESFRLIAPE
jgi:hypothetical protein